MESLDQCDVLMQIDGAVALDDQGQTSGDNTGDWNERLGEQLTRGGRAHLMIKVHYLHHDEAVEYSQILY